MQNEKVSIHPLILKLFAHRQIPQSLIESYLSWNLQKIPNLLDLADLNKAADRIVLALNRNEEIAIFGDYDVDGTSSCALLFRFFEMNGKRVHLIQPSRFVEGYGIHPPNIDRAKELGVSLIITVDCGITSHETASYSKKQSIDLIITDHHKEGTLGPPEAFAIVNPNRKDEPPDSPLRSLAGVGVAFSLALQIKKILDETKQTPSIYSLLPYVALGTICDLAPLNPLNLTLTRHGLKEMRRSPYVGFQTFLSHEERNFDFIPSEKLSFTIGSMINAKGRLDHPEKALELLITNDREIAQVAYNHLEITNRERKFIQHEVFQEAKEMAMKQRETQTTATVVFKENWHEGVIGIVASKLVETFKIPAIVFTSTEDRSIIKASARTAGELDLFLTLKNFEDLYTRFGGHKSACGLSMRRELLPLFQERLHSSLLLVPPILRTIEDRYDLEVSIDELSPELSRQLEILEPFGNGNERPLFKVTGAHIDSFEILKGEHVKWALSSKKNPQMKMKGISFSFIGRLDTKLPDEIFNEQKNGDLVLFGKLGINRFKGNEYLQLQVERLQFSFIS